MKILIFASGKPAMTWEKRYNSAQFDEAFRSALDSEIEPVEARPVSANGRPVYVSTGKSARHTAEQLFSDATIITEELLDEIPQRSCKDTKKQFPLRYWRFMARWQRFWGISRQPETKTRTIDRAEKLIRLLEERDQDCILVSHPIFLKILSKRFRAHGYCVTGGDLYIAPLDRILITKRDMHCGGCGHNCLLSNPGCGVGVDAAKRKASGK